MSLQRFSTVCFALFLTACTSPGAPLLKTEADASGPLIPKCQNVSQAARVDEFNTTDYLTTWGSAWLEGASQGFAEGLNGGGSVADAVHSVVLHPAAGNGAIFNNLPAFVEPFCRSYNAEFSDVSAIVGETLKSIGYPIQVSNTQIGVFMTGFVSRQQPMALWRDNYVITVTPAGLQTEVKVLRSVYISRDGTTYNQGISVGQNETWLLTQIGDGLERLKAAPPPAPPPKPAPPSPRHRKHK